MHFAFYMRQGHEAVYWERQLSLGALNNFSDNVDQ
jgi:hypothetical protein